MPTGVLELQNIFDVDLYFGTDRLAISDKADVIFKIARDLHPRASHKQLEISVPPCLRHWVFGIKPIFAANNCDRLVTRDNFQDLVHIIDRIDHD